MRGFDSFGAAHSSQTQANLLSSVFKPNGAADASIKVVLTVR